MNYSQSLGDLLESEFLQGLDAMPLLMKIIALHFVLLEPYYEEDLINFSLWSCTLKKY